MTTISTSTVERLTDLILDVKRELKQDIVRVEAKVDEALEILREMKNG